MGAPSRRRQSAGLFQHADKECGTSISPLALLIADLFEPTTGRNPPTRFGGSIPTQC
jgi:hypothetical protein